MILRYLHLLWVLALLPQSVSAKLPFNDLAANPPGDPVRESNICPRPELLQANLVTDSTAQLTWTDVGAQYEVELHEASQPLTGTPTHFVAGSPPLQLNDLTPGQQYRFQVRVVCPDNSVSEWSAPRSFATEINDMRPCPLGFDLRDTSCAGGSQFFRIHVDHAPGASLGNDVMLQAVRIMIEHPWRSDLRVWLWSPDSTRVQLIGGLNAGDKNIGNPAGSPCAQYVELTEQPGALPLSDAAERDNFTGYYLPYQSLAPFLNGQNPNGAWWLEICDNKTNDKGKLRLFGLVFAPAGCSSLAGVSVSAVTATSADISWTPGNPGDSLLIEYGAAGFYPGTGGTAGTGGTTILLKEPVLQPFALNGLSTLVHYEVYLRRLCAPGQWSANSEALRFFSNCPPTLLENPDTLATCAAGCTDPCPLPGLWQNVPDDDYEWKVWTGHGLTYPVAGPPAAPEGSGNYLYFRNSCSPTGANGKKAILRTLCVQVDAPAASACHFSLDLYMNTKTGAMGSLTLEVSTNGGQNWQTIKTWSGNQGKEWKREYLNLSAYHGQTALFQLTARGVFGAYGDIAVDNLTFYGSQEAGTPDYTFFRDADGDGYGDLTQRVILCNPNVPLGYVDNDDDCDDLNQAVFPGAPEILCNQTDENCNGMADDSAIATPSGVGTIICAGETAVLTATGAPAGQFYWFENAQGGLPLGEGPSLTLNNLGETRSFFLADSISAAGVGCASSRTAVVATVNPTPELLLPASPARCLGQAIDLETIPVVDSENTGAVHSWHNAFPPQPGNQLPNTLVQPAVSTTYYLLSATIAGCADTLPVTLTINPNPSIQILQGDSIVVCRGKSVNLSASASGAAPLAYTWSNGLNFPNIPVPANPAPGATVPYSVTVTDINGCKSSDLIKVHTLNNVTQTAVENVSNPTVCGGTNGSITLHPLDGTPPYTFLWSGASSGSLPGVSGSGTISGLKQGGYRVTVTDASGGCSMVLPQIVLSAPGFSVQVDTIVGIGCPGEQTGSIQLAVSGVAPVILWSNGLSEPAISDLSGGLYSVTITDGNCVQTITNLEVTSPPPAQIIQNGLLNPACFGDSTGAIDLAVFGATPPYNFHWSNNAATEDLQNIPAGNYSATVTDANGCSFISQTIALTQAPQLAVSPGLLQHVQCFGENNGAISPAISGGFAPYQFVWNTGATSAALNNIPAGNYSLTATDASGCSQAFSATITQPAPLTQINLAKTDPTCIGSEDGSIEITLDGGTAPYHLSWSNGQSGAGLTLLQNQTAGVYNVTATDASGCSLLQNDIALTAPQLLSLELEQIVPATCFGASDGQISVSASGAQGQVDVTWNGISGGLTLTNIPAGPYIVQVRDERGCAIRDTFLLGQPKSPLNLSLVSKHNALCAGEPNGSIDVRATGGTTPYTFTWSNGAATEDLPAAAAGIYFLTVTDAAGCTTGLGPVTITEPPALTVVPSVNDIPCFGAPTGSITLAVTGGIQPYHYQWNTNDSTQNLYLLNAGVYAVTVLDATGCAQVLADLNLIDKGANFSVQTIEVKPVSCPGAGDGKIVVQASNGAPPYQFAWSPPVGLHANVPASADQATGLSGGVYFVTVSDAAGCAAVSDSFIVEEAPPLLFLVHSKANVLCKGDSTGAVITSLTGGLPPYTFLWNNGATTQNLSAIPAGNYTLTATDFRGCSVVSTVVMVMQPSAALQIVPDSILQDQCGAGEGAIFQHLLGGTPPYQFLWSSGQNTVSVAGLPAGQYQLTATDHNGCTKVSQLYDIQSLVTPLQINTSVTDVFCAGDSTGTIITSGSGGTPGYSYFWSTGQTGPQLDNLPAGAYVLTMTDAAGCTKVLEKSLTQPPALVINWAADSSALGWTITLNVSGGAEPYQVQWDAGAGNQSGPVAEGLASGVYGVTVTDQNDCTQVRQIGIGTSGAATPSVISELRISPNPSFGNTVLNVALTRPSGLNIRVTTGAGRDVFSKTIPELRTIHAEMLDIEGLPPGLYFVRVRLDQVEQVTLKWVITGK
ncbi:MAG: T9SS type A sorting domain-containing protein [Lewinellaceae bacterium]|nr:T9SS type A sorting domain-containing protein [Lewinellaceae bacterium]